MTVIKAEIGASSDWDVEELQLLPVSGGDEKASAISQAVLEFLKY